MPFALAFAYLVVEALAFYLVAVWIGVGWAILLIFGLMILGGLWGLNQLRNVASRAAQAAQTSEPHQVNPGRAAGDIGLIMVGALLSVTPGFVTGIVGLLLIFPPTRGAVRRYAAGRLAKAMEGFGTRMYSRSPMSRNHTTYGHFVIDENPEADAR